MIFLINLWNRLSLENKKRIVSFLRVFVSAFLTFVAARFAVAFPETWAAMGAVMVAAVSSALKEGIDVLVNRGKE